MVNRNYTSDFNNNVKVSKEAEDITMQLLHQLVTGVKFKSVRDDQACYHLGDILGSDGEYYDVKDDGVVHRTGNVFCEEKKLWNSGKVTDGWMRNGEYNYLCVLDMIDKNLYVLDFEKLKKVYKQGRFITTNMGDNRTTGYCFPLRKCREQGILVYETEYVYDDEWECYDIKLS